MQEHDEDGPQGGMGKWGDPRVPKRGWTCINVEDLGAPSQDCEMCERVTIRYVHTMTHPDYPHDLECGCVCAGHMEEDVPAARQREAEVRNRAGRRKRCPLLKAWRLSRSGNLTIAKDGCRVTVYRARDTYRISAGRDGAQPRFGKRIYASQNAAMLASFDAFMWAKRQ